jgi:predicted enzyme related to lactoylglutathione lyase
MIQSIAFVLYPVSDIKASRHFYESQLGLKLTSEFGGQWFEYDIGAGTFAICKGDEQHPVPVRGAVVALEVDDIQAEVARLKKLGVKLGMDITQTPVCRMATVRDPDGSEVMLHQRLKA